MNILLVSSYLPYPLTNGGNIRLFNIIKRLSKKHAITLVCEKRLHQSDEDIKQLKPFCKEIFVFPRKKQWSIKNVVHSVTSSYPFLMIGHTIPEMKTTIQSLLESSQFDLIHVETFYVSQNVPKTNIPIVLVEHNIEYLVYKRYVETLVLPLKKSLSIDVNKIKKWEEYYWENATKLVAVSEDEKNYMKRDVTVIPNGVDLDFYSYDKKNIESKYTMNPKKFLFIGDFKWIQNRDAVNRLIHSVWPKVQEKLADKNLQLWVVGKHIPPAIKNNTQDSTIIFDEHAPSDTREIYNQTFALLAPIYVGGGTSYKILESMASGVPVLTTPLGIEGIEAKKNEDILVADSREDFINHMVKISEDKNSYIRLSSNGRKIVEKHYNWDDIVKKLEDLYKSI